MKRKRESPLEQLPSMTALLEAAATFEGLRDEPRIVVTEALRRALGNVRSRLQKAGDSDSGNGLLSRILNDARALIGESRGVQLVRVINATGVVLHTGLGRSVLAKAAMRRIDEAAAGYCNLEIDLHSGQRGLRGKYAEEILCRLTKAEAALIVNNNAAATMLVLGGLAKDREVIVSRGQLIEIGGSFRLPEVMSAGGAVLREVGTTNKTHLSDYEKAVSERTGLIMHVHTSNYRVVGFTESPALSELIELARDRGIPLLDDLGSGALLDDPMWAAANEPSAVASLRAGADVVAFSGDKLLGGPQCGILLGKASIIDRLRKDPMMRALRIGKLTAAALEATLELYQDPARARREIPLLAALSQDVNDLRGRAEKLASELGRLLPSDVFIVEADETFAGGGSLPAWPIPTMVVRWQPKGGRSASQLSQRLRAGWPAVLCRLRDDCLILDIRTVGDGEIADLVRAVGAAAQGN